MFNPPASTEAVLVSLVFIALDISLAANPARLAQPTGPGIAEPAASAAPAAHALDATPAAAYTLA